MRLGGALVAGRFDPGGVASGALPGVYVVVEVEVDFLVPAGGSTRLEAGNPWKVQR